MSKPANVKVSPLLWGRVQRVCVEKSMQKGSKIFLNDWLDAAIRKQLAHDEEELGLVQVTKQEDD